MGRGKVKGQLSLRPVGTLAVRERIRKAPVHSAEWLHHHTRSVRASSVRARILHTIPAWALCYCICSTSMPMTKQIQIQQSDFIIMNILISSKSLLEKHLYGISIIASVCQCWLSCLSVKCSNINGTLKLKTPHYSS